MPDHDDLGPPTIADLCFGAILLGAVVLLAISLASLMWPPLE